MHAENPEASDSILAVATDTIRLLALAPPGCAGGPIAQWLVVSGDALARLGRLLDLQTRVLADNPDALRLVARAVLETLITGHTALLLGADGIEILERRSRDSHRRTIGPTAGATRDPDVPTLTDIAKRLDSQLYGASDPPRAFQRHVASFYEEIDISGIEGTVSLFSGVIDLRDNTAPTPTPTDDHVDHVRVSLWVVLFLAHGHFAAIGATDQARTARMLFDRLRRITDDYYGQRRNVSGLAST